MNDSAVAGSTYLFAKCDKNVHQGSIHQGQIHQGAEMRSELTIDTLRT